MSCSNGSCAHGDGCGSAFTCDASSGCCMPVSTCAQFGETCESSSPTYKACCPGLYCVYNSTELSYVCLSQNCTPVGNLCTPGGLGCCNGTTCGPDPISHDIRCHY